MLIRRVFPATLAAVALFSMTACFTSAEKPIVVLPTPGRAPVQLERLGPTAWRVIDAGWSLSNSLVIETSASLIMVDTPRTPAATRAVIEQLGRMTGKAPEVLLLTGSHLDRLGGASVLASMNVPIVAGEATAKRIAVEFEAEREGFLMELDRRTPSGRDPVIGQAWQAFRREAGEIRLVRPTRVVREADASMTFSGVPLRFIFPGPGRSRDNRVVLFSGLRILFAGCLVAGADAPVEKGEVESAAWFSSVESLMQYDADVVITGHGLGRSANSIIETMERLRN